MLRFLGLRDRGKGGVRFGPPWTALVMYSLGFLLLLRRAAGHDAEPGQGAAANGEGDDDDDGDVADDG